MKMKHTPGPWHTGVRPGPIIYGPNGEQVADLLADLLPAGENQANAHLISAAPEMLAELDRLAESFGWPSDHPACIVIAKAKGE